MQEQQIKSFLSSRLIPQNAEFIKGDWLLKSGLRKACDIYYQVWYNDTSKRWAFNVSQDSDWDPDEVPNCGFHDSYQEMLDNVSHQLAQIKSFNFKNT